MRLVCNTTSNRESPHLNWSQELFHNYNQDQYPLPFIFHINKAYTSGDISVQDQKISWSPCLEELHTSKESNHPRSNNWQKGYLDTQSNNISKAGE
jgi:hypothetical protein